jgi:hypothetical protein
MTPLGIVIGDAPYNFIMAHSAKADVIVSGTSYSTNEKEQVECSDVPLDEVELRRDLTSRTQLFV